MYDMHYDLLTVLYYLNTKKTKVERDNYFKYLKKVYQKNNVIGGLINLYFMSEEQMFADLGITKKEYENVPKMLTQSIKYLTEFLSLLIDKPNFYFSIEGLDYLKNADELNTLSKLNVRSILPVWNNDNKFGGGSIGISGLTKEGEKLLDNAISLNMIIDLSHMNERTFYDCIKFIEKKQKNGQNVKVMVSHSNIFDLSPHLRNLKKEQVLSLKKIGGKFGLVAHKRFIDQDFDNNEENRLENCFLNHIKYLLNLDISLSDIFISTDDMSFMGGEYLKTSLFDLTSVNEKLRLLLSQMFTDEEINKLLISNASEFLKR